MWFSISNYCGVRLNEQDVIGKLMKKMMGIDYCLEWGAHLARMKLGREGEWGIEEIWMGCCIIIIWDGAEM